MERNLPEPAKPLGKYYNIIKGKLQNFVYYMVGYTKRKRDTVQEGGNFMRKIKRWMAVGMTAVILMGNGAFSGVQPLAVQGAIVDGDELIEGLSRDAGYYILPESSRRELSYDEISWLTDSEKQMAINEIYARHGRKFVITQVQQYFSEKSWYQGTVAASRFDENVLSDCEEKNIQKLLKTTTSSSYVLEGSDSRYITDEEVAALTADEMQLAINEIYARHGRKFSMKEYRDYFNSQSWYKGTVEPDKFNEGVLNAYENANIGKLSKGIKLRSSSASSAISKFAGAYTLERGDTSVRLEISLYTDISIAQAIAGDAVGTINVSIAIGDDLNLSTGYLSKEDDNIYLISDSDLNGATLTVFDGCVILLDSCGFDDAYTLVERYES